jgi:hypothetical protein
LLLLILQVFLQQSRFVLVVFGLTRLALDAFLLLVHPRFLPVVCDSFCLFFCVCYEFIESIMC